MAKQLKKKGLKRMAALLHCTNRLLASNLGTGISIWSCLGLGWIRNLGFALLVRKNTSLPPLRLLFYITWSNTRFDSRVVKFLFKFRLMVVLTAIISDFVISETT